jgi:trk system potassium uptake protein TrkA
MKVIVAGGGQVGTYLAGMLVSSGHQVLVIEQRSQVLERLKKELPEQAVISGSATDPDTLESAGVRTADVVAAVTGMDEVNLVVTNLARFEFNVPRTIARVNNPKNAWLFTAAMGVDIALNQADLMAHLIAEELSVGDMMTLLKLRKGQYSLVEEKVAPTCPAAGKALRELEVPEECVLVAIIRKGELLLPRAELVLQPFDEVLALAHAAHVEQLARLLGRNQQNPEALAHELSPR